MTDNAVYGLVHAGGQSRRVGQDKALLGLLGSSAICNYPDVDWPVVACDLPNAITPEHLRDSVLERVT